MVKFKVEDANFNKIYPVGSIYMSINSTDPSELFGGEWEQIKDRFLLACGTTYSNGATGGEATHTLTTNEMPTHSHSIGKGGALYLLNNSATASGYSNVTSIDITVDGSSIRFPVRNRAPCVDFPGYFRELFGKFCL